MAILHGVEVEIISNSEAANEYNDEDIDEQDPNVVAKYLETDGGDFEIRIRLLPDVQLGQADTMTARAIVDGNMKLSEDVCIPQSSFVPGIGYTHNLDGKWTGVGADTQLLHYSFGDPETRKFEAL
jgi:hypothetical protein